MKINLLCRALTGVALALVGPAVAQNQLQCGDSTRLFESTVLLRSPVCIPETPSRIAFIDDSVVYALELGIPTITASYYSNIIAADFPGLAPMLDPATTTDVGNTWEMSGEPLLAADPDLVVTYKYWEDAIGFAEDIAPTIIIDDELAPTWREISRMIASVAGKEAEQVALEATVDERLATLRQAIAATGESPTFSFTLIESATGFWGFTTEAFGPAFAVEAGLRLGDDIPTPEDAAKLADGSTVAFPVSQENLDLLDADHLFFYGNVGSDPEALVKDNELFQRFAAARPGRIHFIRGEYWFRAAAVSAHRIIDDLYRAVLSQEPAEVSPNPLAWTYDGSPRP